MTNNHTSLPLYLQIASKIKEQIEFEDYAIGERLPFENWFVEQFHVSRVTVRKALEELIKEGVIERRPHKGLYVTRRPMQITQTNTPIYSYGFLDDNTDIASKILAFDVIDAAGKLDKIFKCTKEKKLYYLSVLRLSEEVPFALQSIYLKKELLPELDIFLLKDSPLHVIIEQNYHLTISHMNVSMSITSPTPEQAELLHASPMDSLLQATDTLYLPDNEVIRYGTSIYTKSTHYSYTLYR